MFTERKKGTHWLAVMLLAMIFILIPGLTPEDAYAVNGVYVGTEYEGYLYGESIKVFGDTSGANQDTDEWVGIYKKGDTPGKDASLYYYDPGAHTNWDNEYVTLETLFNNKSCSDIGGTYVDHQSSYKHLEPGYYTIYLFKSETLNSSGTYDEWEHVDFYVYDFNKTSISGCQSSTFDLGLGTNYPDSWNDDWIALFPCDSSGKVSSWTPAYWQYCSTLLTGDDNGWKTVKFSELNQTTSISTANRKGEYFLLAYLYDSTARDNYQGVISKSYVVKVSHNWGSGSVTTAATCTATGIKTYTCSGCSSTKTETIAKADHKETSSVTTAATCTKTGVRTYTCSVCKTTLRTETISATGHSYTSQTATADYLKTKATCTANAVYYYKCANCTAKDTTKTFTSGNLDSSNHTGTKVYGGTKAAHQKWNCCGATANADHSYTKSTQTAATCTTKGTSKYTCACGYSYTAQDIATIAHTYTSKTTTADYLKTAATCTAKATYYYKCTGCTAKDTSNTYTAGSVDASNHTGTKVNGGTSAVHQKWNCCEATASSTHSYTNTTVAATCSNDGKTTSTCGCGYSYETAIVKLGHDFTEKNTASQYRKSAANCLSAAVYYKKCSRCEEKGTATFTSGEVDSTNHKNPTPVYAGTKAVHTKYECCGTTASTKHSYSEKVEKAATCKETGTKKYTCACGYSYNETLPLTDHTYALEVTAPTCTEDGYTTQTCSVCKDTKKINPTDKLNHDFVKYVVNVASTCQAKGSETAKCSRCTATHTRDLPTVPCSAGDEATCTSAQVCVYNCGKVFVGAFNHNNTKDLPAVDPTCIETGLTAGKVCQICGVTLVAQKTVNATGHTETQLPAKEATCTENGLTAGSKCTVCHTVTVKQTVIPATDHDYQNPKTVAPTCTEQGYIKETCTRCPSVYKYGFESELGHTWEDATCFNAKECKVCHVTEGNKLTHRPTTIPAKKPTCTEPGNYTYYQCENCKNYYEDADCTKLIDKADVVRTALGHEGEFVDAVAATCTKPGNIKHYACTNEGCNKKFSDEACENEITEVVTTKAHDMNYKEYKAATCTKDGNIAYYICNSCGKIYLDEVGATGEIDQADTVIKAGHNPTYVPVTLPTCDTPGTEHYHYCNDCGSYFDGNDKTKKIDGPVFIDPTGHDMEDVHGGVAPGCETEGTHAYYTCKTCTSKGKTIYFKDSEGKAVWADQNALIIPATGHSSTEKICTNDKNCDVCGVLIEKAGKHTLEKLLAVTPDCEKDGMTEGEHCTVCGTITKEQVVDPKTGHEYGEPTCEEDATCIHCGEVGTEDKHRPKGHKQGEGNVKTPATCEKTGVMEYTCVNGCGKTWTEIIPDLKGHECKSTITTKPTCKAPGVLTSECIRCEFTSTESLPMIDHKWNNGEITVEPGCETKGTLTFTCETCGDKKTADIAPTGHTEGEAATCTTAQLCTVCGEVLEGAKGHSEGGPPADCTTAKYCQVCFVPVDEIKEHNEDIIVPGYAPTCTSAGLTDGTECSVCGKVMQKQEVINMLVHVEVTIPGKEASCKEEGLTAGKMCSVCQTITVDQEVIPVKNNHIADGVATCTTAQKCLICDMELEPVKGHSGKKVNGIGATCTASGLSDGVQCETCGLTMEEQKEIPALGHKPGKAATCTSAQLCTVCQTVLASAKGHNDKNAAAATCTSPKLCTDCQTVLVVAKGHTPKKLEAVAATCTKTGLTEGKICTTCNTILEEQKLTPMLEHQAYATTTNQATMKANGSIVTTCDCGAVISETPIYKIKSLKLSITKGTYSGKVYQPKLTVKDSQGNILKKNVDYKVTIPKGRKNVGIYKYVITFKGNYSGTKTVTLTIQPRYPGIYKPKAAKKAVTVKWKKVDKSQANGYQVMVATNKTFTKNVKKTFVKGYKVTTKKMTGLKSKKTYYVRVRAYKTVNGVKVYSKWSTVKKVKTK